MTDNIKTVLENARWRYEPGQWNRGWWTPEDTAERVSKPGRPPKHLSRSWCIYKENELHWCLICPGDMIHARAGSIPELLCMPMPATGYGRPVRDGETIAHYFGVAV